MSESEDVTLKAIRAELRRTNNILAGVSRFLFNLTLWGLLAGCLWALGFQVELFFGGGGFFFFVATFVSIGGILHAVSALSFGGEDNGKKTSLDKPSLQKQFVPGANESFFERAGVKAWIAVLSSVVAIYILILVLVAAFG